MKQISKRYSSTNFGLFGALIVLLTLFILKTLRKLLPLFTSAF